jgi:hypothetical protein
MKKLNGEAASPRKPKNYMNLMARKLALPYLCLGCYRLQNQEARAQYSGLTIQYYSEGAHGQGKRHHQSL